MEPTLRGTRSQSGLNKVHPFTLYLHTTLSPFSCSLNTCPSLIRAFAGTVAARGAKPGVLTDRQLLAELCHQPRPRLHPASGRPAETHWIPEPEKAHSARPTRSPCTQPGESGVTLGPCNASVPRLALHQGHLGHTSGFIEEARAGNLGELEPAEAVDLGQSRNDVCTRTWQIGSEKESGSTAWKIGRRRESRYTNSNGDARPLPAGTFSVLESLREVGL